MEIDQTAVQCDACPVNCLINLGHMGACKRYRNDAGNLVRITPLHTFESVRDIVGPEPSESIRQPLITAIGAGTTYPDCKHAPHIVRGKKGNVDVVTVVTEAPLSYSSVMIKIDTDLSVGDEGADVLVGNRKVGTVFTEQYGSKMLSIGGVNLLTGENGFIVARTITDIINRKPVVLQIKGESKLKVQVGHTPEINGVQPKNMRIGCGSAVMGLFAPLLKEVADEVIVLDSHITSLMSEHAAGRFVGAKPSGIKLKFRMSTPGRYFGDHGHGWGGTSMTNPLDVIADISREIARPGMRILITETTGQNAVLFELQEDYTLCEVNLSKEAVRVLKVISSNCEPSKVSAVYIGGAGGSARAGVTQYPIKLTAAVHASRACLTVGGAPTYVLPGGGINFMVDVERVKEGSFSWVPTPAIVCPIEYTMELEEYEKIGGYLEAMRPFSISELQNQKVVAHVISKKKTIHVLDEKRVLAEYGPMRLIISSWVGKLPQTKFCISAARQAFSYFEQIVVLKKELYSPLPRHSGHIENSVARAMIESIRVIGDKDLTPMAAVAGSLADAVADFLFNHGMTKVIVDNGGDIAVRLRGNEQVRVKIGSASHQGHIPDVVLLNSSFSSWGIATSGLGGRSFSRGVASAVTILASTASLADAAATAVANATFVEDDNVLQRKAGEIDPNTDIPDLMVTVKAGPLSHEKKTLAIQKGLKKAKCIIEKGDIYGAYIVVDGEIITTPFFQNCLVNDE